MRLERLRAHWSEEDGIQAKRGAGGAGDCQMAKMGRVETAAEEGDAPPTVLGVLHPSIVSRLSNWRCYEAGGSGSIEFETMRYILAFLALAGVVVSALALHVHYSTETEPCSINAKWDCGIVNHSPFSEVAHIPVAAIGIAGYLALAGLALWRRRIPTLSVAAAGLGFALYLSHIEKDVLQVWCLYCVISQGIIALVTLLSLGWVAAERLKKRRARKQA